MTDPYGPHLGNGHDHREYGHPSQQAAELRIRAGCSSQSVRRIMNHFWPSSESVYRSKVARPIMIAWGYGRPRTLRRESVGTPNQLYRRHARNRTTIMAMCAAAVDENGVELTTQSR